MKIKDNTILITGGTSGIGLELAKQLKSSGNTVIITGRDEVKLKQSQREVPGIHVYQSDVGESTAISALYTKVIADFPELNVVINNAGIMRMLNLMRSNDGQHIEQEVDVNLLGPILMVAQFLPHLMTKPESAIVNVSSGLAFIPLISAPIYGATKAGLHAYTQALRIQLENTTVKVFELAPPPTGTALLDNFGSASSNSASRGVMKTDKMVNVAIKAIANNVYEIRPGISNILKIMSRLAPNFMLNQLSKLAKEEIRKA